MTAIEPGADDLATVFATVATILSDAKTTDELSARIVALAVRTVDGCDLAGIMTLDGSRVLTLAASEELVRTLDQHQVDADEGPCLDVLAGHPPEYAGDLEGDDRWPRFSAQAVLAGVRSVLAIAIGEGRSSAALNLYGRLPDAFAPIDRGKAAIFATHARLALEVRHQHDREVTTTDQLREALTMRDVIGQA